eukprot:TRINITY_DN27355_c0_g1_i1.p1 TRINITY_DN27355_c0_g1~~TRINITY_DN27355_c0_g1_i1.p1  ORF type:complete len:136 (-),score=3.36 TRINITY_DN27355_c0_g1_i1:125-505(-)
MGVDAMMDDIFVPVLLVVGIPIAAALFIWLTGVRKCSDNPNQVTPTATGEDKKKMKFWFTRKFYRPDKHCCSLCNSDKGDHKLQCEHYFCRECLWEWYTEEAGWLGTYTLTVTRCLCPCCSKNETT